GGAENKSGPVQFFKLLQEVDQDPQVVLVIEQRILHALPHGLGGRKMDQAVQVRMGLEKGLYPGFVPKVELFEMRAFAGDGLDPPELPQGSVGKVVDDQHLLALGLKFNNGMGADTAQPPGDQYFPDGWFRSALTRSVMKAIWSS